MLPERCSSSVAQLISELSKAGKKLPGPWTPETFVGLVAAYRDLIREIGEKDPKVRVTEQQVSDWIADHGLPGAYSSMVQRRVDEEEKTRKRGK